MKASAVFVWNTVVLDRGCDVFVKIVGRLV